MRRFGKTLLWIVPALAFLWFILSARMESPMGTRKAATNFQLQFFLTALKQYKQATGEYPSTEQGLQALRTNPGIESWRGPYLQREVPLDPWGHAYLYRRLPDGNAEILSLGPEGKLGVSNQVARTLH